jgi:hypothetical protein
LLSATGFGFLKGCLRNEAKLFFSGFRLDGDFWGMRTLVLTPLVDRIAVEPAFPELPPAEEIRPALRERDPPTGLAWEELEPDMLPEEPELL